MILTLIINGGAFVGEVEKLLERKRQLDEKIKTAKAREAKNERAEDTRKKILLGAFIAQKDSWLKKVTESPEFDRFITRNIDRKLFGLTEIEMEERQKDQTQLSKKISETPDEEIKMSKMEDQISSLSKNTDEESKHKGSFEIKPDTPIDEL